MGKTWKQVGPGELLGALERLLVALGPDAGLAVDKINRNSNCAFETAEFIVNWKPVDKVDKNRASLNTQWLRAREIMGKNFFGVDEAFKYFDINPSVRQLADLAEIRFSEAELEACKDTHILVATFPLSILDLRTRVRRDLFWGHEDAWYNGMPFARMRGVTGWFRFPKTMLSERRIGNWLPTAVVYTIIGHFLATGERLYEHSYAGCSGGVDIGDFGVDGLVICTDKVGRRASWKHPN